VQKPIIFHDTSKNLKSSVIQAIWAASDLDEHTSPAEVKLLSVHDNVVNLQVEGWKHLLFIAGPNLEAGPAAVSLSGPDFIFFKDCIVKAVSVQYQYGLLSINTTIGQNCISKSLKISWQKISRKSFALSFIGEPKRFTVKKALHDYRCLLAKVKSVGSAGVLLGLPGGEDYFRDQIIEYFPSLVEALLQNNRNKFRLCAGNLIGLGRGLTPTGDDLLHGLLITYRCTENRDGLREPVKNDLDILADNTNLFGRHMIETGLRGLTPEIFNNFLMSIVEGKAEQSLVNRIGSIGSSSGFDIAIAIMFSLNKVFV
jgi:hypothetical protein